MMCGGKVEMSDDLQNRNVQLIAIRHTDQPRSERLIPLARSDRGGWYTHLFGFSFEAIRRSVHSVACCFNSAFLRRAITAGSFMKSVFCRGFRPRGW